MRTGCTTVAVCLVLVGMTELSPIPWFAAALVVWLVGGVFGTRAPAPPRKAGGWR